MLAEVSSLNFILCGFIHYFIIKEYWRLVTKKNYNNYYFEFRKFQFQIPTTELLNIKILMSYLYLPTKSLEKWLNFIEYDE